MSSPPKWHGWTVAGMTLHVGPLPGRKSIVMYRCDQSAIEPLAYFRSEEQAQACLEVLDALAANTAGIGSGTTTTYLNGKG